MVWGWLTLAQPGRTIVDTSPFVHETSAMDNGFIDRVPSFITNKSVNKPRNRTSSRASGNYLKAVFESSWICSKIFNL